MSNGQLSSDVEGGFVLTKHRRRVSAPAANSGTHRQLVRSHDPDVSQRDDTTQRWKRRRVDALAVYEWLHAHSGQLFLIAVLLAIVRAGLHAIAPPSPAASPPYPPRAISHSSPAGKPPKHLDSKWVHPIPGLMSAASARFAAKLARQSTSLAGAVAEYKRRYSRLPPAGFDKWYNFATARDFVMIDEFDAIAEDLDAFWSLSGAELRRRAELVGRLPSVDVVRVRNGQLSILSGGKGFKDSEAGARARGFKVMMEPFVRELPDVDFTINAKAEGRVVVPWEHTMYPNLSDPNPPFPSPDWSGGGSVWDAWRRTCNPSAPARRLYSAIGTGWAGAHGTRDRLSEGYHQLHGGGGPRINADVTNASVDADERREETPDLGFVETTGRAVLDFCAEPGARYEQGHFFSDWRTLPLLAPLFSPARAQGFADIRIPSHYYYGGTKGYTYAWNPETLSLHPGGDPMEVPWVQKRDAVFWRGASTGGGSTPKGFAGGYQRHRFLRMSSLGYLPGTSANGDADAERTTPVTFALPIQAQAGAAESISLAKQSESPSRSTSRDTANGTLAQSRFTTANIPLAALNRDMMDAAFVKVAVPIDKKLHKTGERVVLGAAWEYKYLLDLDGMGYSGRFLAFLASDSVPVKATVYDEFFSSWIEPWVHYIPLSHAYTEIYNIVAYFSGPSPAALRAGGMQVKQAWFGASGSPAEDVAPTDEGVQAPFGLQRGKRKEMEDEATSEGDRRLRSIARAGKDWKATMGRKVDMEVYVYRLALEYARLWADDREAMTYVG